MFSFLLHSVCLFSLLAAQGCSWGSVDPRKCPMTGWAHGPLICGFSSPRATGMTRYTPVGRGGSESSPSQGGQVDDPLEVAVEGWLPPFLPWHTQPSLPQLTSGLTSEAKDKNRICASPCPHPARTWSHPRQRPAGFQIRDRKEEAGGVQLSENFPGLQVRGRP